MTQRILIAALCAAVAGAALAQQKTFAEVDANGDGVLSAAELDAAVGADVAARLLELQDVDGDGSVTRDEARQTSGPGGEADRAAEDGEDGAAAGGEAPGEDAGGREDEG